MKIRNGFVSNSSSASFVITIKTSLSDEEISEYIKTSSESLKEYWDGGKAEEFDFEAIPGSGARIDQWPTKTIDVEPLKNRMLIRKDDEAVEVHCDTTMFNDWMDVQPWKFIRAISENKIDGLRIENIVQTEDEYKSVNKLVEFDKNVWESKYKDDDKKSEREFLERKNKVEIEYQSYLIKVGYIPTEEEIIEFAKNQLNQ